MQGADLYGLNVDCFQSGNTSISYLFSVRLSDTQDNANVLLSEKFFINLDFQCRYDQSCAYDPSLNFNLFINDYFLNGDNEIFRQRQEYQSNALGLALVYIAKPVNVMTSSNIFARNPTYEQDLYYQHELDYTFDNSKKNYTFQVKIEQTD